MDVVRYTIKVDGEHYWLNAQEPGMEKKAFVYFETENDAQQHVDFLVQQGLAGNITIQKVLIRETPLQHIGDNIISKENN